MVVCGGGGDVMVVVVCGGGGKTIAPERLAHLYPPYFPGRKVMFMKIENPCP